MNFLVINMIGQYQFLSIRFDEDYGSCSCRKVLKSVFFLKLFDRVESESGL